MKKTYNKFLIISTFILFIGGLCLYFYNNAGSNNFVPTAFGSSLESSADATSATNSDTTPSNDIKSDISFLTTLVSLKSLKIDTSIFSNQSFNKLQNNSVTIEPVQAGRLNPFAPMNTNNSNSVSTVVTNQPTQISDKSAVLNGTINTISGVADTYFEYGASSLGVNNITTLVKQSLVGTFVKSISGLTPKTTYSYKACAKINSVVSCGEVVSFTTK